MDTLPKKIPFSVSRDDRRTLVRQVVDGVREAVFGGYYAPGDSLPPYRELATLLGVSEIVTKNALRQLALEGVVESRTRRGSVVRDTGSKQWRGHVVFVCPDLDVGYFQTLFAETLRTRFNKEGYLFTRASVEHRDVAGAYDLSLLDAALARSVDLAVVLYNRPAIFRHLAKRGSPGGRRTCWATRILNEALCGGSPFEIALGETGDFSCRQVLRRKTIH